jgi:cation transport ATPase
VFAVPMTCDSCVKDVSETLHRLQGIKKVEANLQDQLVSVEGTGTESRQPPTHIGLYWKHGLLRCECRALHRIDVDIYLL